MQATTQTTRHRELKDRLHASEMRLTTTLHSSLLDLRGSVSETKGEVNQLGKNQESQAEEIRKINAALKDLEVVHAARTSMSSKPPPP